jgi:hypothetical protein
MPTLCPAGFRQAAQTARVWRVLIAVGWWLGAALPAWAQAPPPAIRQAEQILLAQVKPEVMNGYPVTGVRLELLRGHPERALDVTPRLGQPAEWRTAMLAIVETAKNQLQRPNTAQVLQNAFNQATLYSNATSRAEVMCAIMQVTRGVADTVRTAALRQQARTAMRALPDLLLVFEGLLAVAAAEFQAGHPATSAEIVAEAQPLMQLLVATDPENLRKIVSAVTTLADARQQMILSEEFVEMVRQRPRLGAIGGGAPLGYQTVVARQLSRYCPLGQLPVLLKVSRKIPAPRTAAGFSRRLSSRANFLRAMIDRICFAQQSAVPPGLLEATFNQMTTLDEPDRVWLLHLVYGDLRDLKDHTLRLTALTLAYQVVQSITNCPTARPYALSELAEAYELPRDSAQVAAILRELLVPVRLYGADAASDKPCLTDSSARVELLITAARLAAQLPTPDVGVALLRQAWEVAPVYEQTYVLDNGQKMAALLGDSAQLLAQLPWLAESPRPVRDSNLSSPSVEKQPTIEELLTVARAQRDSLARIQDLQSVARRISRLDDPARALSWLRELLTVPVAPTQQGKVAESVLGVIEGNSTLQNMAEVPALLAACAELIRQDPRALYRAWHLQDLARTCWKIGKRALSAAYLREAVLLTAATTTATEDSTDFKNVMAYVANRQAVERGEWDTALIAAQIDEREKIHLLWRMVEDWYKSTRG